MTDPVEILTSLLDLETIEMNIFRGESPDITDQRVFGGQVAAQATIAAARTVEVSEDRSLHSLHAYFLRPGDPSIPIVYEVDRIRDGRSFTTRRVVAIQHGKAIFSLAASFHRFEESLEHQMSAPTDVPDPESLPDFKTRFEPYKEELGDWYYRKRPIDLRWIGDSPIERSGDVAPGDPTQRVWFKTDGELPDDPIIHLCAVIYASDMSILDTTLVPHGLRNGMGISLASLDHAMWFHRPFRADEWLLYDQDSPTLTGARGLGRGLLYTRDGSLVASVVQEGLIRRVQT